MTGKPVRETTKLAPATGAYIGYIRPPDNPSLVIGGGAGYDPSSHLLLDDEMIRGGVIQLCLFSLIVSSSWVFPCYTTVFTTVYQNTHTDSNTHREI